MQLVAQNGPLAGTALALSDGVTIPIPAADTNSTEPVCIIRELPDGFALHAIDTGTPIFVNGLPITTRRLEAHDELRIGDSLFIVHNDDANERAVPSTLTQCAVTAEGAVRARA